MLDYGNAYGDGYVYGDGNGPTLVETRAIDSQPTKATPLLSGLQPAAWSLKPAETSAVNSLSPTRNTPT